MALKKWIPCNHVTRPKAAWVSEKRCREEAKYIAIIEERDDDDQVCGTIEKPACGEHAGEYNRVRDVQPQDVDTFGVM